MKYWSMIGLVLCATNLMAFQDDLMDMSLEELLSLDVEVETASKKAENANEAPGILSVMTAAEINQFGARNLKELLNRVAGMYMLSTYFGFNNFASVRGDRQSHYDNHTLILLNGRPIRDSLFGSLNVDMYNAFPVHLIERLEVIRGPGSVLYGAGAFAGVINIITRNSKNTKALVVAGGSRGDQTAELALRGNRGDLNYLVGAAVRETDGWAFEAVDETGVPQSFDVAEETLHMMVDLSYKGLHLNAFYQEYEAPYWGATPTGAGIVRESERMFINLGYERELSEKWQLEANLTLNQLTVDPDDGDIEADDMLMEVTAYFQPNEKTNVILGATSNRIEGQWFAGAAFIPAYNRTDTSGYLQIDHRIRPWLKLIGGAQVNKPDGQSSDVVPRMAAVVNLGEDSGLKLLQGEAFRSPASNERDFDTTIILGKPDLNPEKVATSELQYFTRGVNWWMNATAFYIKQKDLIGRKINPTGASFLIYDNLGEATFRGLELEGRYVPNQKTTLHFGWTYQENENNQGVDDFTLLPNTLIKLGISTALHPRIRLGVFDHYTGSAPDITAINPGTQAVNPTADATHLVTAQLAFDLGQIATSRMKDFHLKIYGYNLLDADHSINEFVRQQINTLPYEEGPSVTVRLGVAF